MAKRKRSPRPAIVPEATTCPNCGYRLPLSGPQLAAQLGIHEERLRRWCVQGLVPGAYREARAGRARWRIPYEAAEQLAELLSRGETPPRSKG